MSDGSSLLIAESPLQVLPSLAEAIGLNEAIALQQIHFWVDVKSKERNDNYWHDGRWWVYNTLSSWQEQFPFWSKSTVRRALNGLKDRGVIITEKMGSPGRQTTWYTIDYEAVDELTNEDAANIPHDRAPSQTDTPTPCQSEGGGGSKMAAGGSQSDRGSPNARDPKNTTERSNKDCFADQNCERDDSWHHEYGMTAEPKLDRIRPEEFRGMWHRTVSAHENPMKNDQSEMDLGRVRVVRGIGTYFPRDVIRRAMSKAVQTADPNESDRWSYFMYKLRKYAEAVEQQKGGGDSKGQPNGVMFDDFQEEAG